MLALPSLVTGGDADAVVVAVATVLERATVPRAGRRQERAATDTIGDPLQHLPEPLLDLWAGLDGRALEAAPGRDETELGLDLPSVAAIRPVADGVAHRLGIDGELDM